MIPQEVLCHLRLNADHSREVLQSVLELMISSMDPWKRCHCFPGIKPQSQLVDTTVQGTTQELQSQIICISTHTHTHHHTDEVWYLRAVSITKKQPADLPGKSHSLSCRWNLEGSDEKTPSASLGLLSQCTVQVVSSKRTQQTQFEFGLTNIYGAFNVKAKSQNITVV